MTMKRRKHKSRIGLKEEEFKVLKAIRGDKPIDKQRFNLYLTKVHYKSKKTRKKNRLKTQLKEMSDRRKMLIRNTTFAERRLCEILKDMNVKFKFQKPFLGWKEGILYFADVYIPSKKIVIEVDGGHHLTSEQSYYDKKRTEWLLKKRGISVLRFMNTVIINEPNTVIETLETVLR